MISAYPGVKIMGVLNLTPDSFVPSTRLNDGDDALERISAMAARGADIVDIGAVSSRPGAESVCEEQEWERLEPVLKDIARARKGGCSLPEISIDTTRSGIVLKAYRTIGRFIVNDISAGEDDFEMLPMVGALDLCYVAMHKRGTPQTMDTLCDYGEQGVVNTLLEYFSDFSDLAQNSGIADWIMDPGLGFAKTDEQCVEIIEHLDSFRRMFYRPILIGTADKRFTHGESSRYDALAVSKGASILRMHI